MGQFRPLAAALAAVLAASAVGRAENGVYEITQADIPLTISVPGSYRLTGNASLLNGELVAAGSTWRYLDNGSNQGTAWRDPSFDDSSWASGRAELGYGDNGVEATIVSFGGNPASKHITTYFRHAFVVTNKSSLVHLDLFLRRDDGAVVCLHGNEVARDNMPGGGIAFSTLATSEVPDGAVGNDLEATYYESFVSPTNLVEGTNVLAVEVHLAAANSPDMSFDLSLHGYTSGSGDITNGITIAADGVVLDLGGFVLSGNEMVSGDGIRVNDGAQDIVIRNGTVARFGQHGINADNATNVVLKDIRSLRNRRDGILAGTSATVIECVAAGNGRTSQYYERGLGIGVGQGSIVSRCISHGNYDHGYLVASGCDLSDSIAHGNTHDGIHGSQALIVSGVILGTSPYGANSRHGDGFNTDVGSVLSRCIALGHDDGFKTTPGSSQGQQIYHRCTAISNTADGLKSEFGSLFVRCNSYRNNLKGFNLYSQGVVMDSVSYRNGRGSSLAAGIALRNSGNVAAYNHVVANGSGITNGLSSGTNNVIFGNSAAHNFRTNYLIQGSNPGFAIPTNSPNTTNAWANFRLGN